MEVGKQIRKFRKERGLTQKELAERVNVATGTIQQYELGKREPKLAILQRVALALGVRIEDLVGLETFATGAEFGQRWKELQEAARNSPAEDQLTVKATVSPEKRIEAAWNRLNDDGKEAAASRVEEVAEVPKYQNSKK